MVLFSSRQYVPSQNPELIFKQAEQASKFLNATKTQWQSSETMVADLRKQVRFIFSSTLQLHRKQLM